MMSTIVSSPTHNILADYILTLRSLVDRSQWLTPVCAAATGRVLDAGSVREGISSDVCYVGDTRQSFSEKDDDNILHTHHLCRIVSHRNIDMDRQRSLWRRQRAAARDWFAVSGRGGEQTKGSKQRSGPKGNKERRSNAGMDIGDSFDGGWQSGSADM